MRDYLPGTRSRVSAVIPAYNAERFLADAIQSVLDQSYPCFECVVVDDGSTDGTAAIARAFPEVRLVVQSNGGDARARNRAISEARGEYIAFLDADDVWLPEKIELQMDWFRKRPDLGMVYTGVKVVDADLQPLESLRPAPGQIALRNTLLVEKPYITGVGSSGVVRLSLARQVLFDERLRASADWAFACHVAMRSSVAAVDAPLVLYRQHSKSQVHRNLHAVERDMHLVWSEAFSEPNRLDGVSRGDHRRARANLYLSLAAGYLRQGDAATFVLYLVRAICLRPDRVVAAVSRYSLRRFR